MLAKHTSFLPQSCLAVGSNDEQSEIHADT